MVAAYLIVNLLVSIPVLLCIARAQIPLTVDETGTRFEGQQADWEICTFTGWVTAARSHADIRGAPYEGGGPYDGGGPYQDSADPGGAFGSGAYRSRAAYGDEARLLLSRTGGVLRLTDGTVTFSVVIDDFDVRLHPGQMATVCQAVNGRRAEYIAVINDSTGEQFYNQRGLWRVASPGAGHLLVVTVVGLAFWLLLALVVTLSVVTRMRARRFQYTGVGPLLRRANAEAGALRKPWAA